MRCPILIIDPPRPPVQCSENIDVADPVTGIYRYAVHVLTAHKEASPDDVVRPPYGSSGDQIDLTEERVQNP